MNAVQKYFADFAVLKQTRKEFWGLQGINILDSISYFAMFNIMVVTLSEDYGFSDERAGIVFGVFTVTTTIFLFISGLITDWIGIKKAIVIAQGGLATTRFVLVLAVFMPEGGIRNAVVIGSLFLMAPFMSMMQTVFQA
ncbi:MFS transporter, partial [Myxococcota bacterium]|nr:MFS transporter [Myxococcota bacterium]